MGGNGVYYKDEETCEKDCHIYIDEKDGTYRIELKRGDKKQVFNKLSRTDITLLGKQIWAFDSRTEWKEAIDQDLWLKNFCDNYKKEHGVYPSLRG